MNRETDEVWKHIDRCIECYSGQAGAILVDEPVSRESYEIMRSDMMLAIGMLMALYCHARPSGSANGETRKP